MSLTLASIGTGYVGLAGGACFAELGHRVICVDKDEAKIDGLQRGKLPIYEPGLEPLVARNVTAGRLSFTTELAEAVHACDIALITVGTPPDPYTGCADLSAVLAAVDAIADAAVDEICIATKSTVPVGTARRLAARIARRRPELSVSLASNPEFLREGRAVEDFMAPDRIVIGSEDFRAHKMLRALHAPLTEKGAEMVVTDSATAELIKLASNAFLATRVAFINEVARLCDTVGADVVQVSHGMGLDRRIGPMFLTAGPGYGGSCFPKDTAALAHMARAAGSPLSIIETVLVSNRWHMQAMASKVRDALGGLEDKRIGLLGLAFKPQTDDVRESAALSIATDLFRAGASICAYDPKATENARSLLPDVEFVDNATAACDDADALVIVTDWPEFARLDLDAIGERMRERVLIDLRNIISAEAARQAGFRLVPLGRPKARQAQVAARPAAAETGASTKRPKPNGGDRPSARRIASQSQRSRGLAGVRPNSP